MTRKKSRKNVLNAPIRPLKLDSTEFLLLAFVTISLLIFFAWQQGYLGGFQPLVLGLSTSR